MSFQQHVNYIYCMILKIHTRVAFTTSYFIVLYRIISAGNYSSTCKHYDSFLYLPPLSTHDVLQHRPTSQSTLTRSHLRAAHCSLCAAMLTVDPWAISVEKTGELTPCTRTCQHYLQCTGGLLSLTFAAEICFFFLLVWDFNHCTTFPLAQQLGRNHKLKF